MEFATKNALQFTKWRPSTWPITRRHDGPQSLAELFYFFALTCRIDLLQTSLQEQWNSKNDHLFWTKMSCNATRRADSNYESIPSLPEDGGIHLPELYTFSPTFQPGTLAITLASSSKSLFFPLTNLHNQRTLSRTYQPLNQHLALDVHHIVISATILLV
jgi:hypothetical protein